MEELMRPKEAAKILCVSTSCLRKWANQGKLTVVKTFGNQRRFKLSEIEEMLKRK